MTLKYKFFYLFPLSLKFVVFTLALVAVSTVSGTFFSKKKLSKLVDIHIKKDFHAGQTAGVGTVVTGQPVPVGQFPVEQVQFVPVPQFQVPQFQYPQVSFLPVLGRFGKVRYAPSNVVSDFQGVKTTATAVKMPVPTDDYTVPVVSHHNVQIVPVNIPETPYYRPRLVSVEPTVQAVQLLFKSASSPLFVQQKHFGTSSSVYQTTRSQDYPHVLRHEVLKPVLQEVREVIQPYRTVTQEFKPVQEQVNTIIPKGQYRPSQQPITSHVQFPMSFPYTKRPGYPEQFQPEPTHQETEQEPEQQQIKGL